jgi:hypothetical protein
MHAELVLLNRNVDEMIRLGQCATDAGIWTPQEATRHAARLELLRANVNADFAEWVSVKERADQHRFESERLAKELTNPFAHHAIRK